MPRFNSRLTVDLSEELEERIERQLGYGDSKAAFAREALQEKLKRERQTDEIQDTE